MTPFAHFTLVAACPIILVLFAIFPPRRVAIAALIGCWIFLPLTGYQFEGWPDYSKMVAAPLGILLGILFFDAKRLFAFRLRWVDSIMIIWILLQFVTSLLNDLGAYDGLSAALSQLFLVGLPYFFGRLYLETLDDLKEFALGIVIAGLLYLPFCLFEVRMSPQLNNWIYRGYAATNITFHPARYGLGYRPVVFLSHGLETGMFMCVSALLSFWLWSCSSAKRIGRFSLGMLTVVLMVGALLTKSVGAIALLVMGLSVLLFTKTTKKAYAVIFLALLPPAYMGLRLTGVWTGQGLVEFIRDYDTDRAASLEFRFTNEDILIEKAMERPWFGWGGWGRGRVRQGGRDITITDGYWIIECSSYGLVGLITFTSILILPPFLMLKRCRAPAWSRPEVAAASSLAVVLVLWMIDCLFNAMPNPMYFMASGGLMGLLKARFDSRQRPADVVLARAIALQAAGQLDEAESAYSQAIVEYTPLAVENDAGFDPQERLAECHTALAGLLLASGRVDEAEEALRLSIRISHNLIAHFPARLQHRERLALTLDYLRRCYMKQGRLADLVAVGTEAIAVWGNLVSEAGDNLGFHQHWTDALNDLAWAIAITPGVSNESIASAVAQAEVAVQADPSNGHYWNTLGVAQVSASQWESAASSLNRSVELSDSGTGTGFDLFPLAVALKSLGEDARARDCYHRGVDWMDMHNPHHPDLIRFRAAAAATVQDIHPGATDFSEHVVPS
jgi:tetratricopeptide (TPR) repeat protein